MPDICGGQRHWIHGVDHLGDSRTGESCSRCLEDSTWLARTVCAGTGVIDRSGSVSKTSGIRLIGFSSKKSIEKTVSRFKGFQAHRSQDVPLSDIRFQPPIFSEMRESPFGAHNMIPGSACQRPSGRPGADNTNRPAAQPRFYSTMLQDQSPRQRVPQVGCLLGRYQ